MTRTLLNAIILTSGVFSFARAAAPSCESLFQKVPQSLRYVETQSWGQQIYSRELEELKVELEVLRDLPWPAARDELLNRDSRKKFFHLRVLSQTYHGLDKEFFERQTTRFKKIERLLGKLSLYREVRSLTDSIGEPKLTAFFKDLEVETSNELKNALKEFGAFEESGRRLESLRHELLDYKRWPSPRKDRKYLVNEMVTTIHDLKKRIEKNEFDSGNIEKGLHELRRSLREIIYRSANLRGLSLVIDEGPLQAPATEWFNELKTVNPLIFENPYMPESRSEVLNPILLPKKIIAMITEVVTEIGQTKDEQEPAFYILSELKKIPGVDKKSERRIVKKLEARLNSQVNHREVAVQLQERLRRTEILETLSAFLERQERNP